MFTTPLQRVHAIPRECRDAFLWLMNTCKEFAIDISEVTFTANDEGQFLRAEGVLRLGDRVGEFVVSDFDSSGVMTIRLSKYYRVCSENEVEALGEGMGAIFLMDDI